MSVIPCHRGGNECKWPACAQDCDGRPGRDAAEKQWTQQQIDDHIFQDDDTDDEEDDWSEMMCSMGPDGQCGQAGSEWCDFECPEMAALRAASRSKST